MNVIDFYLDFVLDTFGKDVYNSVVIRRPFTEPFFDKYGIVLHSHLLFIYKNVTRLGEFNIHHRMADSITLNDPVWYDGQYWNFLGSTCYDSKKKQGNELRIGKDGRLMEKYYLSDFPHRIHKNLNSFVNQFVRNASRYFWRREEFLFS